MGALRSALLSQSLTSLDAESLTHWDWTSDWKYGQDWTGMVWPGLEVWPGLLTGGMVRTGLAWYGQDWQYGQDF